MHKALHSRDDVDRLNVSRKEEERGLASTENSVDASIQRLEYYIRNAEEDCSDQKQYGQHKHQLNKNIQKPKMGRKTTVRTFQAANKQNLT